MINKKIEKIVRLIIFVIAIVILCFSLSSVSVNNEPENVVVQSESSDLLELTNKMRTDHGLISLKYDERLESSAMKKACDLRDRNYWSHVDPDGNAPWHLFEEVGYDYSVAGENLARSFETNEAMIKALMDSPTHRANILNKKYQDIGIGECGNFTVFHYGVEND